MIFDITKEYFLETQLAEKTVKKKIKILYRVILLIKYNMLQTDIRRGKQEIILKIHSYNTDFNLKRSSHQCISTELTLLEWPPLLTDFSLFNFWNWKYFTNQ